MIIPKSTPCSPLWEVVRKVPVLMGISTRTYWYKYTYLWQQVHVLLSIGNFCGLSEYTRKKTTLINKNHETGHKAAEPNAFPSGLKSRYQDMMAYFKAGSIAFGTI